MKSQRETALEILKRTMADSSYASLLMRRELNKIPKIQRGLVSEIVYGVLRNWDLLLYQFESECDRHTRLTLKVIICMALYERFFLNEKDYVTNSEYVSLGRNDAQRAFINAILHKIHELEYYEGDSMEAMAVNNSIPLWIVKLLSRQYGEEDFKKIMEIYARKPQIYYRLNPKKCKYEDLSGYGINIINEHMFTSSQALTDTEEFKKGYFYVQDYNSSLLTENLDLEKEHLLLDVCAAPGTKLFNCLEIIDDKNAYANDIYPQRVELIKKKARQLGYENVNYLSFDGRYLSRHLNIQFDRILLDAPCSGLGVIGRKPDLKFHVKPEGLDELEKLQEMLLDEAAKLLKKEGILLYATCTLNTKENTRQAEKFLERHPEFELLKEETLINDMGDCFYCAKLLKV